MRSLLNVGARSRQRRVAPMAERGRIGVELARVAMAAVDRVHDRPGRQGIADAT